MSTTLAKQVARLGRGAAVRGVLVAIAVITISLIAGCSSSTPQPASSATSGGAGSTSPGSGTANSPSPSDSASSGNISTNNNSGGQGNEAAGTYTVAFARCMRAHGVSNFPDPTGQSGQLGPSSGVDPTSPQFQEAINGPCLSLAPPGWVSSGKVTR
jgi:hypothetical protein